VRVAQESIALTPSAPGGLWTRIVENLTANGDIAAEVAASLRTALGAKVVHFDRITKAWEETPDSRAQLDAIKLILAYCEGMPLAREFRQQVNETRGDLHDALRESPQLLAAVEREVSKAKFRTRHVKQAAPVELEAP
jgi:hypothetical protein